MPAIAELEGMLRAASLRVTRPRVAVLAAVHDHPHADTYSIIGAVREDLGEVSQQAVYDVLQRADRRGSRCGASTRRAPWRATSRGSATTITTSSAARAASIADVDCAVGDAPCLTAADDHGFAIDEAEVIYWGLCPVLTASPNRPRKGSRV